MAFGSSSVEIPAHLLAGPLTGERLFHTALVARLQIEGVLLDVLDDVFLLNLALESAKGALDRLTFLDSDFCQLGCHPLRPCRFKRVLETDVLGYGSRSGANPSS